MKMVVIIFALVALAVAAPPNEPQILRSEFDPQPGGGYKFAYETDDGSQRDEVGELKQVPDEENKPRDVITVRGTYSYIDKEGNQQTVTYEADELGYRAEGSGIPKRR